MYDGLDIHGFVTIHAPNVIIKNSIIRGGIAKVGSSVGLVSNFDDTATNFVLEDSELVPEHPSVAIDGVMGWNFLLLRDNIHGTVDTVKVFGNNAKIAFSWLHDTVYYLSDPYHDGGPSHNDGIQVLSGIDILIVKNTIMGGSNSALQVTQDHGAVADLWFYGNWVDGGACTVNITNKPEPSMNFVTVYLNRFGHNSGVPDCPILSAANTQLTAIDNVYDDTGLPAPVRVRS